MMDRARLVATVVALAAAAAAALGGCAAGGGGAGERGEAGRGWIVSLRARESRTNFYAKFDLDRAGVLTYEAAREGHVAWSGRLTAADEGAIVDLVASNPEPARAPLPPAGAPGRQYLLSTCPPGAPASRTIESGPTEYLDRLYDLMWRTQRAHRASE
jgi:hypothetical protein